MKKRKVFDAAAYKRKIVEQSRTFTVEMPSGFAFTLRRPNVQTFAASGLLPSRLFQKMLAARGSNDAPDFSAEEAAKMIEFSGALVRAALVVPRIADNPTEADEIRFEDISDADFAAVVEWCNSGGVEGENLTKFRRASEAGAGSGADRPAEQ